MKANCPNCNGPAASVADDVIYCEECEQHFRRLADGTWSLAESPDKAPTEESLGTRRSEDGTEADPPDSDDELVTSEAGDDGAAGGRQQPAASEPANLSEYLDDDYEDTFDVELEFDSEEDLI